MLQKLDTNISEDYKEQLFDNLFIKPCDKHIFFNGYEEQKGNLDISLCTGHHIDTSKLENMNAIPIKLSYILKINMELGIKNTCLVQPINRERIESLSNYFRKEINNINISFGYANNIKMNQFNFSNNLALLKKMYKSWTNGSFESICDNHGKVAYCHFIPNKIFCQNDSYINPFHRDDMDKYKFTIIPTISQT